MKLYVDLETLDLIGGPGFRNPISALRFKRGDAALLEVAFLTGGTTPAIIGDPATLEMQFGIKPRGRYDVGYLGHTAEWTMPAPDAVNPVYQCSPSFNTVELDSALGVGSSTGTELSEITLMGEITWHQGTGQPTSTRTFIVVVENDVNRGTEGIPSEAEPAYPAPQSIAVIGVDGYIADSIVPFAAPAAVTIGTGDSELLIRAKVVGGGMNGVPVILLAAGAYAVGEYDPRVSVGLGGASLTVAPPEFGTLIVTGEIYDNEENPIPTPITLFWDPNTQIWSNTGYGQNSPPRMWISGSAATGYQFNGSGLFGFNTEADLLPNAVPTGEYLPDGLSSGIAEVTPGYGMTAYTVARAISHNSTSDALVTAVPIAYNNNYEWEGNYYGNSSGTDRTGLMAHGTYLMAEGRGTSVASRVKATVNGDPMSGGPDPLLPSDIGAAPTASPTFTGTLTLPPTVMCSESVTAFIGGTGLGSYFYLKSTTGAGTPSGLAFRLVGGTNGNVEVLAGLNNGKVGIGTSAPSATLYVAGNVTITTTLGVTGATTLTGTLTANGATILNGALTANGAFITTPQALSGAGAVNVTTLTTALTTTGTGNVLTLADGTHGQLKTIVHRVDGGSAVLTPTTKTGFTTITFTNAGDAVVLQFFTTIGWVILSIRGATAV